MAMVTSELIWLKSLLASLGVFMKQPIKLFCDNQAALHIAKKIRFFMRGLSISKLIATLFEKGLSQGSYTLVMFLLNISWQTFSQKHSVAINFSSC